MEDMRFRDNFVTHVDKVVAEASLNRIAKLDGADACWSSYERKFGEKLWRIDSTGYLSR